jgi:effector-binding domain-containing protein
LFFSLLTKKWHFFVGMPASKRLKGEGKLKTQSLPNQRYARAVHRGPYQQCAATYRALYSWAKSQGLTLKNESIECYVNDPNEVDKADIETVILIPIL